MRAFYGRMIVFAAVAAVAVGIAGGQPPFGGFKGKGTDYFGLVNNGQVRAELKLTDEQTAKLPVAALKALGEVLDAGQLKRLREIYLRQKGNSVYLEKDIRTALKITDEQAAKIKAALDTQAKEQAEMFQSGGFDFERMQELQKTATDTVQGTLTQAQKTAFEKMLGEPFEFKGFGFGKKKD
jgi:hypothetical protein